MRPALACLINTAEIELWPARLLRARSTRDARALAQSTRVLRRKRDGVFLATDQHGGVLPLLPRLMHEPGIHDALDALDVEGRQRGADFRSAPPRNLSIDGLDARLAALGIDSADYAQRTCLTPVAEPTTLALAGRDRYQRPLWLRADAARAWQRLQRVARDDGVAIDAISGYRSHAYQTAIVERKRARGQSLADILQVNAAPGFSEHHSGRALDIGTPGEPPAEESFDATAAFDWLRGHAPAHGFTMSYPRDNPHGIVYEPWHWAYGSPTSA